METRGEPMINCRQCGVCFKAEGMIRVLEVTWRYRIQCNCKHDMGICRGI